MSKAFWKWVTFYIPTNQWCGITGPKSSQGTSGPCATSQKLLSPTLPYPSLPHCFSCLSNLTGKIFVSLSLSISLDFLSVPDSVAVSQRNHFPLYPSTTCQQQLSIQLWAALLPGSLADFFPLTKTQTIILCSKKQGPYFPSLQSRFTIWKQPCTSRNQCLQGILATSPWSSPTHLCLQDFYQVLLLLADTCCSLPY